MPLSSDEEKREKQLANLKPGQSPGRPVGARSWSTVVKELLDDEALFATLVENMDRKPAWLEKVGTKTLMQAITTAQAIKAMGGSHFSAEWLRKTGYGDKIDITSDGERIRSEPVIISMIRPREIIEAQVAEQPESFAEETEQEQADDGSSSQA